MELTQTLVSQQDGILTVSCVGILDEHTAPAILGSIVKYAKEAPQVALIDFTQVTAIKTVFINGMIEVSKYIKNAGGAVLIIPGPVNDILEITGIKNMTQTVENLEAWRIFARSHFPHILDFILWQKQKIDTEHVTDGQDERLKNWSFFSDPEKKNIDIEKVLKYAILAKASDTHLAANKPITYRIEGVLVKIEQEPSLTGVHLTQIKKALLGKHPEIEERLDTTHDADFGYITEEDHISFRVNGAWTLENLAFTFRRIEQKAKSITELGLPEAIGTFLKAKQGLVLVTGPTGSWKSTTLVAMLEEINRTRWEKIITIEDPIEFLFTDGKSTFNQREVGRDTNSFVAAIRAAMREDPDVVMVWEMRDTDTVEAALNLAETGHLVFSTLHTSGSVQTISRIIQFFDPEQQRQIYTRLADSLIGVISQRLVPRRDGSGKRIALFELMLVNSGIKNLIRSGDLAQVNNAIQMGRSEWMIPMYVYAQELEKKGIIHRDDYMGFFTNQDI
jgi:twitching motility protein PilT